MSKIKVGVVGVGNCANSLISGIEWYKKYYKNNKLGNAPGLVNEIIDKYKVTDIEVVAAFDVDENKVNKDISEAIFSNSNLAYDYKVKVPKKGVIVQKGPELDGVPNHLKTFPDNPVKVSKNKELTKERCAKVLKDSGAEILLNFLPTGSRRSALFYADVAINIAKIGYFNGMPELIVCDKKFQKSSLKNNVPIVGDDCKSQLGGTAINRAMAQLLNDKGIKVSKMYQINYAGNTDFYNMLERSRLTSKKISKTNAVQSQLEKELPTDDVHIGPSDHVPWLEDRKWAYIRLEGTSWGDQPWNIELKLEVEDSPNSAGVAIDAIRCAKIALDKNVSGSVESASAYFMKSPSNQMRDDDARRAVEEFTEIN